MPKDKKIKTERPMGQTGEGRSVNTGTNENKPDTGKRQGAKNTNGPEMRRDPDSDIGDSQDVIREFFVGPEEMAAVGSLSRDFYLEQTETHLRAEGVQEYLSFLLANEVYALNIFQIKEIIKPLLITSVPRTDPVILGILSLRGSIVPVIDLRRRLGLETTPQSRRTRILIANHDEELMGLLVDEVKQVIYLNDDEIEPPPGVFDRVEAEHILGVGRQEGEMYTLLNLDSIIQIDSFLK